MKTSTFLTLFATISVAFAAPFTEKHGAREGNTIDFGNLNSLIAGVTASTKTITSSIDDLRTAKGDVARIQYLVPRINVCLEDMASALAGFGKFQSSRGSGHGNGSNSSYEFDHRGRGNGRGDRYGNQGHWGSAAIGDLTTGLDLSAQLMTTISEALNSVKNLGPDVIESKSWDHMCDLADGLFGSLGLDFGTLTGTHLNGDTSGSHRKGNGGILGNLLGGGNGLLDGILH